MSYNDSIIKGTQRVLNETYTLDATYIKSANGAYIEDVNGKVYIDLALGAGTHILGHNNPLVVDAVINQVRRGTLYIAPNLLTCEFAETLYGATGFEQFIFCNSGAEATMRAMRVARAFTGKKKIAVFSGGWHGGQDNALFDDDYSNLNSMGETCFKSSGILEELRNLTIMLPYNSDEAFEIIKKNASELALVIIEPSQGSNPRDDVGDFLKQLREVTAENDVLLCFDEVITGFRMNLGGGSQHYDIVPDLCTYGKTVGGGFPIGIVTGRKVVLDYVSKGKDIMPTFFGGTFSANPLSMAAGNAVVSYLQQDETEIYGKLDKQSARLKDHINKFCIEHDIPVRMMGVKSMMRLIFTDKEIKSRKEREVHEISRDKQIRFYQELNKSGIYVGGNGIIFLSVVHESTIVDKVIDGFCLTLKNQLKGM